MARQETQASQKQDYSQAAVQLLDCHAHADRCGTKKFASSKADNQEESHGGTVFHTCVHIHKQAAVGSLWFNLHKSHIWTLCQAV